MLEWEDVVEISKGIGEHDGTFKCPKCEFRTNNIKELEYHEKNGEH